MEGAAVIHRPVALVCTGYGTHPVRELVVLVPVAPRRDLASFGFTPVDPENSDTLTARLADRPETDSERRGFGVAGSLTVVEPGKQRQRHKGDARLVNTPGIGWQVVGRGCPTCHQPALVVPVAWIAADVAAHYEPGDGRVNVDLRPPPC